MKIYLLKRKSNLSKESLESGRVKKISLYLAIHPGKNQKRQYEFLNLHLFEKPKNQIERDHNKQTFQLAETIHAKRVLDAQSTAHGFISNVKGKLCFIQYVRKLADKRYDSIGNHGNWLCAYEHLKAFNNNKELPIEKVDEIFLEGFKEYLLSCKVRRGRGLTRLNRNTAESYFNKIRAALREAYQSKMIKENPAMRVKCIKGQEVHRQFLTIEELQKLSKIECEDPMYAKAFLFGCITGLRFSDIKALTWGNIKHSEADGYHIQYTQKKTKKPEILPIAEHSLIMLGEKRADTDLVFENLQYSAYRNKMLQAWINKAGINKKISFHCSRHTQAVMQLSLGTDIFTVSKLLGHQSIKTTMHYMHIIDQHKIDAVNKIPQLL